jgi:hypothetical protein
MQVHPLVPFFKTFIDGISMTVASLDIAAGAAANALLILSASVAGGATGPTFGAGAAFPAWAAGAGADGFDCATTCRSHPTPSSTTTLASVNRIDTLHLQE